jgi:16S rRNA (uracil1498-N3)-methyltransferase
LTLPVFRATPLPTVGPYRLGGPAGRHAAVVRRMRAGEELQLVDGIGGRATGTVTAASREHLDVQITAVDTEPPPAPRLVVVQALAKGDRGELAVELLTEVGADELVPWSAARSVVRWDAAKAVTGQERWQRVADAAAEQSRRVWWPVVAPLEGTAQVADRVAGAELAVVLHENAETPLASLTVPAGEVVVVVGPEGGIDPGELAALVGAGAQAVRLGHEVLRTSSAGIAAAGALLAQTGRWGAPAG